MFIGVFIEFDKLFYLLNFSASYIGIGIRLVDSLYESFGRCYVVSFGEEGEFVEVFVGFFFGLRWCDKSDEYCL